MEKNEIEELEEYCYSLNKYELIEKLIDLLLLYRINDMKTENIINIILDFNSNRLFNFQYTKIKNYVDLKICDSNDDIVTCSTKFYEWKKYLFNRLLELTDSEVKDVLLLILYGLYASYTEHHLVQLFLENFNNYKVNNSQFKILTKIKNKKYGLSKNFKILKNSDEVLVLKDKSNIFKFETDPFNTYDYKFDTVLNEIFVSKVATNKYKGFSLIKSGLIKANCPKNLEGTFCSVIEEEYIEGVTFKEWTNNKFSNLQSAIIFSKKMLDILLELFTNLYHVHKDTGYTHYDLHLGNIILTNENIPYIIDYGFSHVTYNGKYYGKYMPEGEIYNRPMWLHDVFKVLMCCYYVLYEKMVKPKEKKILNIMSLIRSNYEEILEKFGGENLDKLSKIKNYADIFPYFFDENNFKYNDISNKKLEKFYNHLDVIFDMLHAFLVINESINLFFGQSGMILIFDDIDRNMDPEKGNIKITIINYMFHFKNYLAPTKDIQDNNKITFEEFIEIFKIGISLTL